MKEHKFTRKTVFLHSFLQKIKWEQIFQWSDGWSLQTVTWVKMWNPQVFEITWMENNAGYRDILEKQYSNREYEHLNA